MTREEMDFIGSMNMCDEISNEAYRKIITHCEEQEPCEDVISREAVLDCFKKWQPYMATRLLDFEKELSELPPVTPQPKIGHWIVDVDRWGDIVTTVNGYRCSECDTFDTDKDTYCPNCGAKMEVEK